jgi:predicted thioesterase
MITGLKIGSSKEIELTVTPEMRASFVGETVHDLYSTSWLVHHMEWAARQLLLPYLSPTQEAMGSSIEVSHLMLTLPGMKVRLHARVIEIRDNKVVSEIEASNQRGKIARGTFTQSIVEKSWLDKKMKEMALIHNLSTQSEQHSKK